MNFLDTVYNCPKLIAPTIKFTKYLVNTIFIAVPIILVIMGSLDFGKAVVAKEESDMKKAQTLFFKRVLTGISIFFIFSIVSLVINIVSDAVKSTEDENTGSDGEVATTKYNWAKCWDDPMYEVSSQCGREGSDNYDDCIKCESKDLLYNRKTNECYKDLGNGSTSK